MTAHKLLWLIDASALSGPCILAHVISLPKRVNFIFFCRRTALLVAYSAHAIAALASLWNVVDAPAIAQHFRSQRAVNDVEGCAETKSNDKAGSQTATMPALTHKC